MNTYSFKIEEKLIKKIKSDLLTKGFTFEDIPHAHFKASNKNLKLSVNVYLSNKVLIQGKGTEDFIRFYIEPEILKEFNLDYAHLNYKEKIGMDESGKGDYFGPLVVSAVYVKTENFESLSKQGIMDSKKINDKKIPDLASIIQKECPNEILLIGPKKYNELYTKFANLNDMLSWAHLKCLKNLTQKTNADHALLDRFCSDHKIQALAKKMNININLRTEVRGEHDIAVAAASILSRNAFLSRMASLSKEYNIDLPKGGGDQTIKTGKKFIEKYDFKQLDNVAKMHFKNTEKINVLFS